MNFFKNLSLGGKVITISTLLAAIFLSATVGYLGHRMYNNVKESNLANLSLSNHLNSENIKQKVDEIVKDIQITGESTYVKLITTDSPNITQWKNGLINEFSSHIQFNPGYAQLRYIGPDGKEVVRVNNIDGEPVVTEEEKLQDKSNRDYFIEAKQLNAGEIYFSPVELNREGNPSTISKPLQPVFRYAIPLYNESNTFRGIIVANVNFKKLVEEAHFKEHAAQNYIVDQNGFYLWHSASEKLYGNPKDLNTGENIKKDYGSIIDIFNKNENQLDLDDSILSSSKIYFNSTNKDYYWVYLEEVSKQVLLKPLIESTKWVAGIGILVFIFLFFVFSFSIRKLLTPLKILAQKAEEIRKGQFNQSIEINSKDEIGLLANSLKKMKKSLKNLYQSLEKNVKIKTKELEKKVNELQKSKRAMINVANDLNTEREQVLHERDKLNTVLQSIGDGVFVIDENSKIIIFNQAAAKIAGVTVEKAIGKPYKKVLKFVDEKTGKPDPFIDNVFKSKDVQEMGNNTVLLRKNRAQIPVADSAAPLKNRKGDVIGVIVVFRDVTKERSIDQAKTEFVSLASHQLRTPLTAINWYTEMILAGDAGKINKQQREYLDEIYNGNQTMLTLVNSLLNVSRIDLGTFMIDPEETDIIKLCKEVIKEMKPTLTQKEQKVTEHFEKQFPKIDVDPNLMRIIFQNYISNAAKYTPEKGKITIGLKKVNSGETFGGKEMRIDSFVFYVKDTGYGIPEDQQEKIFSKLFRADNVRAMQAEGTGLGLYIIKSIVESSKGMVWFESKENKGSVFYASLPITGMIRKEGQKGLT